MYTDNFTALQKINNLSMPVSNAPKIVCKKQYDTDSSDANVKQNIDNMTDLMQIFSKTDK